MYSTLAVRNSKRSGKIIGTHQQIDKIARRLLETERAKNCYFPTEKEILRFEGMGGPDGLKRKSPGKDEPMHFIIPSDDDGKLIGLIDNHVYNLKHALKTRNDVRASFEAAWLAHAITDGLTPAHHFPLLEMQKQLMTEKEFYKIFGVKVKGIMHGRNVKETLHNNWLYWGKGGYMSKHIAFEYGVALEMTALPMKAVTPKITKKDLEKTDVHEIFYDALEKVAKLDMYTRFVEEGWTADLVVETKQVLLPEIIKAVMLTWNSVL